MAYNLTERFLTAEKPFPLLDPGSYQNVNPSPIKPNKVPFLAKCLRNTEPSNKIWTHAIYISAKNEKIPNCTSFLSKVPRFEHEKWNNDEEENEICQCATQESCKCTIDNESGEYLIEKKETCQAKVHRKIFKGATLRSLLGENHLCPSRKDFSFETLPNGSRVPKCHSPPFYDTRNIESTSFYRGCKWSNQTSNRGETVVNVTPGPADYDINGKLPTAASICDENLRAFKRKTTKQLRFLDKVYRQNLLEALPGPASYSPSVPIGTNLKYIGSKAKRLLSLTCNKTPTPASYSIKRDFDVDNSLYKPCLVRLRSRAPFGVRDRRFKYRFIEGPSPASYDLNYVPFDFKYCNVAPFGSSSKRFKDIFERHNLRNDDRNITVVTTKDFLDHPPKLKHVPTWEFRSKTIRMKPLFKEINKPSPADFPQFNVKNKRLPQFQYTCPFFSSEARFQRWFNWIPVHGNESTQGPAYYNPEKPPTNRYSTFNRSQRFVSNADDRPSPNTYSNENGIKNVLMTHNQRLQKNIENQHVFYRKYPKEEKKLSLDQRELKLLDKSIALLDVPDVFNYKKSESEKVKTAAVVKEKKPSQKLLRYFIYAHQVKRYF